MCEELVNTIGDYLSEMIMDKVNGGGLRIGWKYNEVSSKFTHTFQLVNTQFIVVSVPTRSKFGMCITPDEKSIRIDCKRFINNFEQVADVVGEFEKALLFFAQTFPVIERRKFISENSLILTEQYPDISNPIFVNLGKIANKYMSIHNLVDGDEYGAKEIALHHLIYKEYFQNMKKK